MSFENPAVTPGTIQKLTGTFVKKTNKMMNHHVGKLEHVLVKNIPFLTLLKVSQEKKEIKIVILGDSGIAKNLLCHTFFNKDSKKFDFSQLDNKLFGKRKKKFCVMGMQLRGVVECWDNDDSKLPELCKNQLFFVIAYGRNNEESFNNIPKYVEIIRKYSPNAMYSIVGIENRTNIQSCSVKTTISHFVRHIQSGNPLLPKKEKKKLKQSLKRDQEFCKQHEIHKSSKISKKRIKRMAKAINATQSLTCKITEKKGKKAMKYSKKINYIFFFFMKVSVCSYTRNYFLKKKEKLEKINKEKKYDSFENKKLLNVLKELSLHAYIDNFLKQKIIFDDLKYLDDEDLESLIKDKFPRRRLRKYIEKMHQNSLESGITNTIPSTQENGNRDGHGKDEKINQKTPDLPKGMTPKMMYNNFENFSVAKFEESVLASVESFDDSSSTDSDGSSSISSTTSSSSSPWKIDRKNIVILEEIGSGSFGSVKRGIYSRETIEGDIEEIPVAIKSVKLEDQTFRDQVKHEIGMLIKLNHPNIVNFYGCWFDSSKVNLVMELCGKGDLEDNKLTFTNEKSKISALLQIARGMEYIHSMGIIHRDLKPQNILIDDKFVLKIADYGAAKNESSINNTLTGTITYLAPELLSGENIKKVDYKKLDIYSYGIMMWELIVGQHPYSQMKEMNQFSKLIKIHRDQKRPNIELVKDQRLKSLISKCWDQNPNKRPTFKQIMKELAFIRMKM